MINTNKESEPVVLEEYPVVFGSDGKPGFPEGIKVNPQDYVSELGADGKWHWVKKDAKIEQEMEVWDVGN
ncbi:MAG: hypothetical protein WCW02_00835 [Candidatus Buchananbacteria bacterium]